MCSGTEMYKERKVNNERIRRYIHEMKLIHLSALQPGFHVYFPRFNNVKQNSFTIFLTAFVFFYDFGGHINRTNYHLL